MDTRIRDRMLKLKGGCEHRWVEKPKFTFHRMFGKDRGRWCWLNGEVCGRCHRWRFIIQARPAVGDGHEPTAEELISLWGNLNPGKPSSIRFVNRAANEKWVELWAGFDDGFDTRDVVSGQSPNLCGSFIDAIATALDDIAVRFHLYDCKYGKYACARKFDCDCPITSRDDLENCHFARARPIALKLKTNGGEKKQC